MLKIIFIAVCVLVAQIEAKGNHPPSTSWEDYKSFHGKQYESTEHEAYSRDNFHSNAAVVAAHNEAFKRGDVSYTKELNKFADMDPAVFNERNGAKPPSDYEPTPSRVSSTKAPKDLPQSFDWRKQGKVSPVKDQQQCGSCWAFSTTGGLESQILIKNLPAQSLSEQQIISCDPWPPVRTYQYVLTETDNGCGGGWYTDAWAYLQQCGGIESEAEYPYGSGGGNSGNCSFNVNEVVQTVSGYKLVDTNTQAMMKALVENGPLSVAIDASDWMLASDGIYSCNQTNIDHAVLAVGYDTADDGTDYWIMKNSWGTDWGDNGFFKLARGDEANCGITYKPAYPTI